MYNELVVPGMRFRNDIVNDHINHRTRGEGKSIWEERLSSADSQGAQHPKDGLHDAA